MQKMMTKEILEKAPALYATEDDSNPDAVAHYFSIWNGWDWYLVEYDPDRKLAFGRVDGWCSEFGYFSIDEMEEMNRKHGYEVVERDMYWQPRPVNDIPRRQP